MSAGYARRLLYAYIHIWHSNFKARICQAWDFQLVSKNSHCTEDYPFDLHNVVSIVIPPHKVASVAKDFDLWYCEGWRDMTVMLLIVLNPPTSKSELLILVKSW